MARSKKEIYLNLSECFKELSDLEVPVKEVPTLEAELVTSDGYKKVTKPNIQREEKKEDLPDIEVEVDETVKSIAEIKKMQFNDIKKKLKELGVEAKGNKQVLTDRLIEALGLVEEKEEVVEQQQDIVQDAPQDEQDTEELENEEETLYEKVERSVAEMTLEEIGDTLSELGLSPKGKRTALIDKLVKAVEDGLIELEDEESEGDSEHEVIEDEEVYVEVKEEVKKKAPSKKVKREEVVEEEPEDDEEGYEFIEFINPEYFNEEVITQERGEAIEKLSEEISEDEKTTEKKKVKFINAFYLDHEMVEDAEIDDMYLEAKLRLIDDEGEVHEMTGDPYILDGKPACCGHWLKQLDGRDLLCEVCGEEYEEE